MGVTLPRVDDLASLYADRQSQDFQPKTGALAEAIKRIAFRRRAKSLLRMVPRNPAEIIDYGCGSGLFTECLRAISGATVHALDFHDIAPENIRSVQYRPFAKQAELRSRADLLVGSHVLEHDDDPVRLVREMATLIRSGGYLVIEVPNIDCWWARVFGSYWDGWYLPYHRLHFSRQKLRSVIEIAGLEIVRESVATVPTMGRTLANIARRRYSLTFLLAGAMLQPIQLAAEWLTSRPSALRICARKP